MFNVLLLKKININEVWGFQVVYKLSYIANYLT